MQDLLVLLGLIALGIGLFLFCGQRDMSMDSVNARIALLEERLESQSIPHITIEGRASVYAGSGEIIVERIDKE